MEDHCLDCQYKETCDIYKECSGDVSFCDGCADEDTCPMLKSCDAGYNIECNNGYTVEGEEEEE